jgi:hypothetical protein
MADDVLLKKAANVERSVGRAREEYAAAGAGFATDFTRQDAAVMNIQRACEAELVKRKVRFTRIAGAPEQRLVSAIAAVDELLAAP